MRSALISPLEARGAGYRVVQVEDQTFEVAKPFFWVECPDDCKADEWVFVDPKGFMQRVAAAAPDHLSRDGLADNEHPRPSALKLGGGASFKKVVVEEATSDDNR